MIARSDKIEQAELLGHLINSIARLEGRITQLRESITSLPSIPNRLDMWAQLGLYEDTQIKLRKSLLELGGPDYLVPYWYWRSK